MINGVVQNAFYRCLCVAISLLPTIPLSAGAAPRGADSGDAAALVNTYIGSKDDGNTFPGASAPFGLIQVSPIGEHYSGWR